MKKILILNFAALAFAFLAILMLGLRDIYYPPAHKAPQWLAALLYYDGVLFWITAVYLYIRSWIIVYHREWSGALMLLFLHLVAAYCIILRELRIRKGSVK